jgi:hypothetical protein
MQHRPPVLGAPTLGMRQPFPVQLHGIQNAASAGFAPALLPQRAQSTVSDPSSASTVAWKPPHYYAEIPNKPLPEGGKVTDIRLKPEISDYSKLPNADASQMPEKVRLGIRGATGFLRHTDEAIVRETLTDKRLAKESSSEKAKMVTRCPIQVEHLEKKVKYGIDKYLHGNNIVAAGLTLEEACQQHPEQVWGTMLRIFMAEGWNPVQVYQALPEDVKDAIKAREPKRPQNFLQAAWRRETDKMMMDDDWYFKVTRAAQKGRNAAPARNDTSSSQPSKKRKADALGGATGTALVTRKQESVVSFKDKWDAAEARNKLVESGEEQGRTPEANLDYLMQRARLALIDVAAREDSSLESMDFNAQQAHGAQLLAQKIDNFIRKIAKVAKFEGLPVHTLDNALGWLEHIELHRIGAVNYTILTNAKIRRVMYQKLFRFLTDLEETSRVVERAVEPPMPIPVSRPVKKAKREKSNPTMQIQNAQSQAGEMVIQSPSDRTVVNNWTLHQRNTVRPAQVSYATDTRPSKSSKEINQMQNDAGLDFDIAFKNLEDNDGQYEASEDVAHAAPKAVPMTFGAGLGYGAYPAAASSPFDVTIGSHFGVNSYASVSGTNVYSTSYTNLSMSHAGGPNDNGIINTAEAPQEAQFLDPQLFPEDAQSSSHRRQNSSEWFHPLVNTSPTTPSLVEDFTESDESGTPSTSPG